MIATSRTAPTSPPGPDRRTREPFAALPHAIAGRPDVSPTEKAVLLALLFWCRAKAECWPSDRSIGDRIGRSPGTVQRALRHLEGLGLVERRKVDDPANRTGRVLVLRWRVTPAAPATDPRQAPARDECEKTGKSTTPRIGPAERPPAAEREGETAEDPAELARLAECADMPEPIRRMAAAALARLATAPPDVAPAAPKPSAGMPIPQPIRPVERSTAVPTTHATLIPPRAAQRRSRPAWLEAMARTIAGG